MTFGARRTSNDTPDRNDVGISSSALRKSSRREARAPEVDEWEGTITMKQKRQAFQMSR